MVGVDEDDVRDALHQHPGVGGRAVGQGAALGSHDLGGGQRGDKSQLPQHILCPADAAERLAAHKAEYLIDIQLPGNGGERELRRRLTLPLGADGIQNGSVLCVPHSGQRPEVGVLEEGMESRTHLGGGEAVLREEARALEGGLLRSVDEAGHADLGRDVRQRCRRIPPAEALPQRLHKGRVGLGPGRLFRLGGGFFGREDIGLHRKGDGAPGVRKGQLEVPGQTAERPAVGVDEERRPQPVGEAARLSVQGLPRPGGEEGGGFCKGVGRPADAQRDRQDQLILRPGEGHIQKPHLLAPHLGGMDRGEGGVGRRLIGPLAALGTETEARAPDAVEQDGLAGVGGVELPGRVGHEHHRELQALGAVDGHDGDAAGPRPAGGSLLPGGARQRGRVDGTDEGRDAARARPGAEGGEAPRVLPAALAVLHGTEGGEVAGGNKNFFQQFLHRHAPGHPAQDRQTPVERLHPAGEIILRPALDGL